MCKKSLRRAIDTHKRLLEGSFKDGDYGNSTGDDRKRIFNKRLSELEPDLAGCPFCGELPVYDEGCLSPFGVCSGGGGWSANITCETCDYVFKGGYGGNIVQQWNERITNASR